MTIRMMLTAGVALLALGACSRSNNGNSQPGIAKGAPGLEVNTVSAANDCISPADQQRPVSDFTTEQRLQIVGCINTAAARQMNAQLPRQIDALTRLDRLTTSGPQLTYNYTILRPLSALPEGTPQRLETATRAMVCAQPQMRQTLQLGGTYGYRWVDSQGALIHEITIQSC